MRVEEYLAHHNFLDRYRWANTDLSSNSNIVVILHFDHSRPKLRNILFHLALAEGKVLELIKMLILATDNIFRFFLWSKSNTFDEAISVIVLLLTRQGQISFNAFTLTRGLSCLKTNIDDLNY